jgi:hypothetical protein
MGEKLEYAPPGGHGRRNCARPHAAILLHLDEGFLRTTCRRPGALHEDAGSLPDRMALAVARLALAE